MKWTLYLFLGLVSTVALGGCSLFHGDPNDSESYSAGVGVLQPQMRPPADPIRVTRPILPISGTGQ